MYRLLFALMFVPSIVFAHGAHQSTFSSWVHGSIHGIEGAIVLVALVVAVALAWKKIRSSKI